MITNNAKGIRRFSIEDLLDNGNVGDFYLDEARGEFWIECPNVGLIRIPTQESLENGARWQWDGNVDAPTLTPSINVNASLGDDKPKWHGWMRNGELISC